MSREKVYQPRAAVDKGLRKECVWVPGTPAKLIPLKKSKNESVLSFPGEKITGTEEQSGRGIEVGLIDLNKTIDEIDESQDVSLSDYDSNVFAFATPEHVVTDVHVVDLNQGIGVTEAQLTGTTGIPSFIVASQEPVILTTQKEEAEAVDITRKTGNLFGFVDSPKENFSLQNSHPLIGSNQRKDVNNVEKVHNGTNSPESCLSQHVQQIVTEDLISATLAENLNPQPERKTSGRKQKPKRKKHRPRVLVEGKPEKTPQPKTPKPKKTPQPMTPKPSNESTNTKRTKRKRTNASTQTKRHNSGKKMCVRENSAAIEIASAPAYINRPKRARRVLNFDDDNLSRAIQGLNFNNLSRASRSRSSRRRRLNTLFMRVPVGISFPKRMKRLRRASKRCNLNLLAGIPICDSETNNNLKNEDLSFTPNLAGSLGLSSQIMPSHEEGSLQLQELGALELFPKVQGMELLSEQRFFPVVLEEIELFQEHILNSLRQGLDSQEFTELFPRQRIHSQDFLPGQEIGSLELLKEQIICSQEHLQEQKMTSKHTVDLVTNKNAGDLRQLNSESRGSREETIDVEKNNFAIQKSFPLDSRAPVSQEENKALVISDGGQSSTMVPYQEPDKRKKRFAAKVDLDPETLRRWNIIMNIDGGTTTANQKTDKEKEKWWKTERNVFEGRIKSFTSRLHVFLGDRRFKPWKGSVVDSVVGVYLTQNVSDNLSSSAYMSLAAKFPPKSITNYTASNEVMRENVISLEGNIYYVTEPELEPEESGEPEPEESYELKDRIEQLDELNDKMKHLEIEDKGVHFEIGDMNISKNTVLFSSVENFKADVTSANKIQLFSIENFKADVASPNKSFNMDNSAFALTKNPQVENTLLQKQDEGDNVSSSEDQLKNGYPTSTRLEKVNLHYKGDKMLTSKEDLEDVYATSTRIDNGNQASTSGRNDLKNDGGTISLRDSTCPFEISKIEVPQSHDDTAMIKKMLRQKRSKLKESNMKKDATKKSTPKKKNDNRQQQDWDLLRRMHSNGKERGSDQMDSVDWEAVRRAEVSEIADAIKERGQHNIIAGRIKDFLNRLVELHNCIDLEWLRDVSPDKVKEYLLEIKGLGLKSVECVRLLSLQHIAFPVDVNVGRIAVRLGWVPLQTLPGDLHFHLLEEYPLMDSIQKYLWPRLCCLDQRTLYELHYQMITFGKVFCTKKNPNCGACPLRGECKHFASAFASARLALPGPSEKRMVKSEIFGGIGENPPVVVNPIPVIHIEADPISESGCQINNCEPIIEEPSSPEHLHAESPEPDIEDFNIGDIEDIPTIRLQEREFKENFQNFLEKNKIGLQDPRALVSLTAEAASMPARVLKRFSNLRTEHLVYVLPENHEVLLGFERLQPDDDCPYLLAIWSPGETPNSCEPPKNKCNSEEFKLCNEQTCYSCNKIREENAGVVRGTILIPCRSANRGRFPLNGTYFQVNEVFADHETSYNPINVPRNTIANLPTQTTYFGTSATSIYRGLDLEKIQKSFWRGFICVRGFDRKNRSPRPLSMRFHISPSKMGKGKQEQDH